MKGQKSHIYIMPLFACWHKLFTDKKVGSKISFDPIIIQKKKRKIEYDRPWI